MKRLSDAAILNTVQEEQCNSRYGSPYRAIARKAESEMLGQVGEWAIETCPHNVQVEVWHDEPCPHNVQMEVWHTLKGNCRKCWQELKEAK